MNTIPFDAKLRALRGLHGFTQTELAERAEIGQWDVTTCERGLVPSPAKKEAIERVFGIKFDAPEVEAAFAILAGIEEKQLRQLGMVKLSEMSPFYLGTGPGDEAA